MIDFISRDKREFLLAHPSVKKDIQDFAFLYLRNRTLYELLIVDSQFNTITSKKSELINRRSTDPFLLKATQGGELTQRLRNLEAFFDLLQK
jgi:hypothetical protein